MYPVKASCSKYSFPKAPESRILTREIGKDKTLIVHAGRIKLEESLARAECCLLTLEGNEKYTQRSRHCGKRPSPQ